MHASRLRQHDRCGCLVAINTIAEALLCWYRTTANYSNPLSFQQARCFYILY
jgi:hypothetical protein